MKVILTASPAKTPVSKLVKTTAITVKIKGMYWYFDLENRSLKILGFASVQPVAIKIAAKAASGIWFRYLAKNNPPIRSKTPWIMVDNLDLAPEFKLAEDRTITDVIGNDGRLFYMEW